MTNTLKNIIDNSSYHASLLSKTNIQIIEKYFLRKDVFFLIN